MYSISNAYLFAMNNMNVLETLNRTSRSHCRFDSIALRKDDRFGLRVCIYYLSDF